MYIEQSLLDLLISKLRIEYNGCHSPNHGDGQTLYGRAAYWRVYDSDGTYLAKITTPVKTMEPKPKTLEKLFRAELQKRIEAIHERCTTDHYGHIQVERRDPYSMRRMLDLILNRYYDLEIEKLEKGA